MLTKHHRVHWKVDRPTARNRHLAWLWQRKVQPQLVSQGKSLGKEISSEGAKMMGSRSSSVLARGKRVVGYWQWRETRFENESTAQNWKAKNFALANRGWLSGVCALIAGECGHWCTTRALRWLTDWDDRFTRAEIRNLFGYSLSSPLKIGAPVVVFTHVRVYIYMDQKSYDEWSVAGQRVLRTHSGPCFGGAMPRLSGAQLQITFVVYREKFMIFWTWNIWETCVIRISRHEIIIRKSCNDFHVIYSSWMHDEFLNVGRSE